METQQEIIEQSPQQREIELFAPITFGFTRTFKNAGFWVLFSLLNMMVIGIGFAGIIVPEIAKISETPDAVPVESNISVFGIIMYFIMLAVLIFLSIISMRQAIREVSAIQPDYQTITEGKDIARWNIMTKDIAWGKIIPTLLLIGLIAGLFGGSVGSIIGFGLGAVVEGGTASAGIITLFAILGIALYVIIFALAIMVGYATYFAADPETNATLSPIDCIKASWNAVKPHFWVIFGFNIILMALSSIIISLTLGLGMIIVIPAATLAQAHMFRQVAGLYAPVK